MLKQTGPVSCQIELTNGTVCNRHYDHVRVRQENQDSVKPNTPEAPVESHPDRRETLTEAQEDLQESGVQDSNDSAGPVVNRPYPKRTRKPPDRFM